MSDMAILIERSQLLHKTGSGIRVVTDTYSLELSSVDEGRASYALLSSPDGRPWTAISLLASVHTASSPDETWELLRPDAVETDDGVTISVEARSTAWTRKRLTFLCTNEAVELSVTVEGRGDITDLTIFGGQGSMPNGAGGTFRSAIEFESLFVPVPTEPVQFVRPAHSSAALGVVGDADPGRLNAIFSPPPLVFGFGREQVTGAAAVPGGEWLGVSVRAHVTELTFNTLRYEPLDSGYLLRLDYEGHTAVDGQWTSPVFVIRPADSGWAVIEDHRADLVAAGYAGDASRPVEGWWLEPIFCGWGAQCARLAHRLHADGSIMHIDPVSDTAPETAEEENVVVRQAPSLARQTVYDEFLARLEEHDLSPGTIVIDDRWQEQYGSATPDADHWPDLRGWIAQKHAEGRKVLLWWKAWDPAGIPLDECILDAGGRAVAVDPANPAYRERLKGIVSALLSADGLDADGFKVDFTQRAPSGRTLAGHPGSWGVAGLHLLLDTLYRAAKEAKRDSLVICHAVHPSFGDVCDMVRLNDVSKKDIHGEPVPVVDQLIFRHEIARRTLPNHVIDTDQWPMPDREQWLAYSVAQIGLGVPALYYLESIDRSGERIDSADLAIIARSWRDYRGALRR
ncbi:MAG: hypothetical protein QOI70_685 [Microbacteriaceae bacterium]|nr:hypothetical protein [Microbacteriaceae bacterium]